MLKDKKIYIPYFGLFFINDMELSKSDKIILVVINVVLLPVLICLPLILKNLL